MELYLETKDGNITKFENIETTNKLINKYFKDLSNWSTESYIRLGKEVTSSIKPISDYLESSKFIISKYLKTHKGKRGFR